MESVESVILLDVPEGQGQFDEEILRGMGHRVLVCHGPEPKSLCPILAKGGDCSKATGAHGIVFELDLQRAQHRAILRRYQDLVKPGIPIRVLVREGQLEEHAELLKGVEVWSQEPSVGDLDAFSSRVEGFERATTET